MVYNLPISTSTIVFSIALVLALPIAITLGTEYALTKKLTPALSFFISGLSLVLFIFLMIQLNSKIVLDEENLTLTSLLYSKKIPLSDISSVSQIYHQGLPEGYTLKVRQNGVGLKNYWAGKFSLHNGLSAYVLMSSPPLFSGKNQQ